MAKAGVNFFITTWKEEAHKSSSKKCCVCVSPQKCEVGKKFMLFGDDTHVHCAYAYIPNQIHEWERENAWFGWRIFGIKIQLNRMTCVFFHLEKKMFSNENVSEEKCLKLRGSRSSCMIVQFQFSSLKNGAKILRASRPFPPTTTIVIIDVVVVRVSSPNCWLLVMWSK